LTKTFSVEKTYLSAVVFAGFALRLLVILKSSCIEMDGIGYATIADQFAKGLFRQGLSNVFSPMYPFFVSLLHLAVPDVELAGRLTSLFFGVLLICLSFVLANRLFRDRGKAIWMAALVAFHPYLVRYSGQVLSESLATFLFTLVVFLFYVGWQDRRRGVLAACGFCLVLAYLTRPEYLVFYGPLALLLLIRKRLVDCLVLVLPFFALGALYIFYLHAQSGMWTVSARTTLSPFVALGSALINIPFVSYDFVAAILPFSFFLAILGILRVPRPYRNLAMLLVTFHILSLSFISHSSKRYSVEFVPLLMVFSLEGIFFVVSYLKRFLPVRVAIWILAVAIVLPGAFEPFSSSRDERGLQKQAGLFLLEHGKGSVIAARLPLAAFYAKGRAVDLLSEMPGERNIIRLNRVLVDKRVDYLVVDEELEKEMPFLRDSLSRRPFLCSLDRNGAFVRIYRVS
jgi:hypothetical protein